MYARRRLKKKVYRLERIGDFLPRALRKKKIYIDTLPPDMEPLWKKAVGHQIARQTEPFKLKDDTLSVKVTTSTWMQQLQFMKEDILEKVNAAGPPRKITKLRFFMGQVTPAPDSGNTAETPVHIHESRLRDRDKRLIEKNLSNVTDEELREALRRVMVREALTRSYRS